MAEVYEQSETIYGFGRGDKEPSPCDPVHKALADTLFRLLDAKAGLERAIANVPDYTGQWDPKDYYANEQETFNRCVDAFGEAVKTTRGDIRV